MAMFEPELHWVSQIAPHRLALMARPRGGEWLEDEILFWKKAALNTVVTLLEAHEVRELALKSEATLCEKHRIDLFHFPIPDRGVPASELKFLQMVTELHARLLQGQAIAIHCRAGIGRTGLVAGCLLHLLGTPRQEIFPILGRARGVAVPDTVAQVAWVERFARRHKVMT